MEYLALATLACLAFAPAAPAAESPWNGTWKLDASRPEPEGAAPDYRFAAGADGTLRWEIPSLHEDNHGRLDGIPMPINRPGVHPGTTIRVWAEAPRIWRYAVALNGMDRGEGRMALATDGRSWTDVPLDHGKQIDTLTMVYIRQ